MSLIKTGAIVRGHVQLDSDVNVWYNAVIRSESENIHIQQGTNVQDNCVIHTDHNYPVSIGKFVTIGHGAIVHGCTIEDECLIGMGATILNGAHIGKHSIVGAGALVPEGMDIPEGSLVVGVPARIIKQVSDTQISEIKQSALHYIEVAKGDE